MTTMQAIKLWAGVAAIGFASGVFGYSAGIPWMGGILGGVWICMYAQHRSRIDNRHLDEEETP